MRLSRLLLGTALAFAASTVHAGSIQGTVVNTTRGAAAPCQAEVVLQLQVKGQFVPYRVVASDSQGRFFFGGLPVGAENLYLVGANRHGIFYPGPRIRLTELQPAAAAELAVCDAVTKPNPLVLKKMDVTIRPETGMLKVTESLVIDNPSHTCYVGEAAGDNEPITLALSIPPDFERMTFEKEFFGRRFLVANNLVVTSIPWTPGEREIKYTYVLRNTQEATTWRRPMDLPCADVTVRVEGKSPDEVRCDRLDCTQADAKSVIFASAGQTLSSEQVLSVELGRLPLPWMAYSKWAAVAILLALIAVTGGLHVVRRHKPTAAAEARRRDLARRRRNSPRDGTRVSLPGQKQPTLLKLPRLRPAAMLRAVTCISLEQGEELFLWHSFVILCLFPWRSPFASAAATLRPSRGRMASRRIPPANRARSRRTWPTTMFPVKTPPTNNRKRRTE